MAHRFGWDSVAFRFGLAAAVVFATWNPLGWSFWHWATADPLTLTPMKGIVGVLLVIGWVVLLRATMRSLGGIGVVLTLALLGFVFWGLMYWGVLPKDSFTVIQWVVELVIVGVLTAGVSWSHVRRRLSGQYDIDDVDQE